MFVSIVFLLFFQRGQLFINPAVLLQTDRNSANKHTHPVDQQAFSTASSITANSRDNMDPALQGDFKNMTITTKPKVGGYGEMSEKYQINNGVIPQIEIPDEKDLRYCVLSFEQVKRLNDLMSENIPIHGRGNFPTIDVKLCDLVSIVRTKLEADGIHVREIRLNGSGASSVLAADFNDTHNNDISYNDLDLIFSVDLATGKAYDRVKTAVLDSLLELLPPGVSRKRMSSCSLKEAYVSKMVKVNDTDRWSLITLGNNRAKTIELKFVNNMKRQYEFSVDSFHIMLDTLFLFYECSSRCSVNGDKPKSPSSMSIGDNFYPTVVGESMYGDFHEALYHLQKKLISTKNPEEIRGGGLLKYCNLLCKGYRPAIPEEVKNMERYMCSRFFIDFSDINQQQSKLENYLYNHFVVEGNYPENDQLKYEYLMILYQVVDESTVCLMGHERRLTLALIEDMAFQVYNPPYYPIPPPEYPTNHNLNGKPEKDNTTEIFNAESLASSSVFDQSSSSAASTCSSMSTGGSSMSSSASSTSSSGTTTPQKPPTPGPVIQTMMAPAPQYVNNQLQTTVYQQIHRHTHNHPPPMTAQYMTNVPPPTTGLPAVALTNQPTTSVHQYVPSTQISTAGQQQISTTNCNTVTIPTYEIVTSCQPAVIYSGGYYYTSFMSPSNQGTSVAITDTSSPPPQISGQLPTTATVQQLPTQQVNVGSQQPSSALPCTCTCSCNQWPALAAENQTSAVHMVPAVPPPSTHQHVSAPPPCCITQPIVCT